METRFGVFFLPECKEPEGNPIAAVIIFISFIFLCGYFLVSMSLAAVAIGFTEKLEELKDQELYGEASDANTNKADDKKKTTAPQNKITSPTKSNDKNNLNNVSLMNNKKVAKLIGADKQQIKIKKLLKMAWGEIAVEKKDKHEIDFYEMSLFKLKNFKYLKL